MPITRDLMAATAGAAGVGPGRRALVRGIVRVATDPVAVKAAGRRVRVRVRVVDLDETRDGVRGVIKGVDRDAAGLVVLVELGGRARRFGCRTSGFRLFQSCAEWSPWLGRLR
jgi:hypothetical protein